MPEDPGTGNEGVLFVVQPTVLLPTDRRGGHAELAPAAHNKLFQFLFQRKLFPLLLLPSFFAFELFLSVQLERFLNGWISGVVEGGLPVVVVLKGSAPASNRTATLPGVVYTPTRRSAAGHPEIALLLSLLESRPRG